MAENCAIWFAGSGQDVDDKKHVYADWAEKLYNAGGYQSTLRSGVGKVKGTSGTTGKGWAGVIDDAMESLERRSGGDPKNVIIVGMSRGGVQAVVCAHCVKKKYPRAEVFIFAVDPVQGAHTGFNDGSFDMSDNRNLTSMLGFRGSRGVLKEKYGLGNDAPSKLPAEINFYLAILAQFRGASRACWGFTPQDPSLGNLNPNGQDYQTYEVPGDHGYCVYTGAGDGDDINEGRKARGRVALELFSYHLKDRDFISHGICDDRPMKTMDYYCKIANEDLAGLQVDKKVGLSEKLFGRTKFSFLKSSRAAGAGLGGFEGNASSRVYAGRGQLVKSMQAVAGKGYFVNTRHQELYVRLEAEICQAIYGGNLSFVHHYQNIGPWLKANLNFQAERENDAATYNLLSELGFL